MNKIIIFLCAFFFGSTTISAQVDKQHAKIIVHADSIIGVINPNIYGQMVENCGNCLYPGLWVGTDSEIPNIRGMRLDVIEKFKEIKTPIVRWPGGTPAEYYHWLDGVGDKKSRPKTLLPGMCLASPGETNAFGTDEFMDFCKIIGAEPYICANVGTGTAEEAANWVEYCNREGETQYASLRKKNGHEKPYNVKYWGIGNESYFWHTPDSYALVIKQYAKVMKTMVDTSISLVASGLNDPNIKGADKWNYTILKEANEFLDYISLHAYYFYDDYYDVVASPLITQQEIDTLRNLIRELVPADKKLKIAIDEWNIWHKEAKTYNGLMQKCTLTDGIFAAGMFHVFHKNNDIVTLANFCDLVNQLPAIVTNEKGELYVNPIFLSFKLYTNFTGNIAIATKTISDGYKPNKKLDVEYIPYLDCSATKIGNGDTLSLAVINRNKDKDITTDLIINDFMFDSKAKLIILNADSVTAANDFEHPETVILEEKTYEIENSNKFVYNFPAHSVTVIQLIKKKDK